MTFDPASKVSRDKWREELKILQQRYGINQSKDSLIQALDHIDALEKRVAELRGALQRVCDGFRRNDCMDWDELERSCHE